MLAASLALFLALVPVAPVHADGAVQRISPDLAECIRDNADRYLAEARPVYFISIAGCADGRSLAEQTTASSATPDTTIPTVPDGDPAALVVLTQAQIACLRDRYTRVAAPLDGSEPLMLELRFDGC